MQSEVNLNTYSNNDAAANKHTVWWQLRSMKTWEMETYERSHQRAWIAASPIMWVLRRLEGHVITAVAIARLSWYAKSGVGTVKRGELLFPALIWDGIDGSSAESDGGVPAWIDPKSE